jgi:hypothetical protein
MPGFCIHEEAREEQREGVITFWYKNYKGEEGYRRVKPVSIRFGMSEWYKKQQWLLLGDDTINHKRREFAIKDMSSVIGSPTIWIQGITN